MYLQFKKYGKAFRTSFMTLWSSLPIMFGILLIINLLNTFGKDLYRHLFTGHPFTDALTGAVAGSFSFGIPITSYIVGGELLGSGIGLVAITAFIMTWTTVGIAMLPLEGKYLGIRFAVVRNTVNFFFAMAIAVLTVLTLTIL